MYSGVGNLLGLLYVSNVSHAWNLEIASSFLYNLSNLAIIFLTLSLLLVSSLFLVQHLIRHLQAREAYLHLVFQWQDQ